MRKFSSVLVLFAAIALCLPSCKPNQAKRAAEQIYKEYRKVSEHDGIKYLKAKNCMRQLENVYNQINVCSACNGYGIVYHVNEYGYYETDYNGNPLLFTCDKCGGDGKSF